MHVRSRLAAAFAALLCVLCVLCAPAVWASGGPTWTAQPAAGGGRPYVYMEGVPGTVLEDKLSVTNRGAEPLAVRLRSADLINTAGGAPAVRGPRRSDAASTWITLAANRLTVPPRTRAEVPFSVTVPAGALPGDHPGAVVVESGDREAGVRIQLRVSGPTLAALTVEDVSVSGGAIHYSLVNRGNTALTPRLAVRADGLFGEVLRRPPRTLSVELLPGRRVSLTEKWLDPPSLDSVDVRVQVTAEGAARSEATASAAFVPWLWVAAVAVALVAAVGTPTWLMYRRHPADPRPTPEQTSNEDESARSGA
ncbi:COG1470 family protein [Streptomyces sp. NPDC002926]